MSLISDQGGVKRAYLLLLPAVLLLWSAAVGFGVTAWLGSQNAAEAVVDQWAIILGKGFWGLLILWLIPLFFTRGFYTRFVGPATPGTLGAMRAVICFILIVWVMREDLGTTAMMPRSLLVVEQLGLVAALYRLPLGLPAMMDSVWACRGFQAVTVGALLLGMLGWRTRLVVPVAFVCCLIFGAILRSYSFFWHQGLVPLYVLGLLCVLPCGDGFSLDRKRRQAKGLPVPAANVATALYGWSRYLVWALVAATYVLAGASKLRTGGFYWWWPDNMRRMLMIDVLGAMNWDFKFGLWLEAMPSIGWAWMGICGVWGEVLFGLVLVSAFWRKVMPLAMLGMHIGILLLQNILFLDLMMIQVIYYDWRPLAKKIGAWLTRRESRLAAWWPWAGQSESEVTETKEPAAAASSSAGAGANAAALPRGRVRWAMPAGMSSMVLFLAVVWMQFIEVYPVTGMRMYSNYATPETIHYLTTDATYADGRTERADYGEWLNNMGQARFRPLLHRAFQGDDRRAKLDEFLAVATARANAKLDADQQIEQVIIERHAWRYILDRDSPTRGEVVGRYVYHVDEGFSQVTAETQEEVQFVE